MTQMKQSYRVLLVTTKYSAIRLIYLIYLLRFANSWQGLRNSAPRHYGGL